MASNETFAKALYIELSATQTMRNIPRFGKSSSFADIWKPKEAQSSYIVGLLFAGIFLFSIFFIWTTVLLIFKFLGRRRVGFLSGAPLIRPADPTIHYNNRPFLCRLVFLNASLLFIIFSVLFVTEGLTNLRTTMNTLSDAANDVTETMTSLNRILVDMNHVGKDVTNVRNTFLDRLGSGGTECLVTANVTQATNRDYSPLIGRIRDALEAMGNFRPSQFDELQNATAIIEMSSTIVAEDVNQVTIDDWQSLIILIPFIITPSLFLLGVSAAWFDVNLPKFRRFLSWCILPIFVLQTIFAYSLSSAMMISASANADFCSGGRQQTPDGTVKDILLNLGYTQVDLVWQILTYYIDQCSTQSPFDFLTAFHSTAGIAMDAISEWTLALGDADSLALSEPCRNDVDFLLDATGIIKDSIQVLIASVSDLLYLLRCDTMVRLYTYATYNGACAYCITGVTWAFSTFCIVGFMGLLMITLRSSWMMDELESIVANLPGPDMGKPKYDLSDDDEVDEYGGYTGYDENNDSFKDLMGPTKGLETSSFEGGRVDRFDEEPVDGH